MMAKEEQDSTTNFQSTEVPSIRMVPLGAFIRGNQRYEGESYEDYRASMKIQQRVRKWITRLGSQHCVGYDASVPMIHWTFKYNNSLVPKGSRRRFHNGTSRHKRIGDKRRGSLAN